MPSPSTELEGTPYASLAPSLEALLAGESDLVANAANCASLLYHGLPDLSWVGFYFLRNGELVVGPFQGKPACVRIPLGSGVCGTAALTRETQVVDDVHEFPGHIACDPESRSETVVPLVLDGELIGVLDVDSRTPARFGAVDRAGLEHLAAVFLDHVKAQ